MKSSDLIPEALADALGRVVAECRKQWEAELELLRAERRALIAELRLAALGNAPAEPEPVTPTPTKAAKPKVRA